MTVDPAAAGAVRDEIQAASRARETSLAACRRAIQASGRAIRATHRGQADDSASHVADAGTSIAEAQKALDGYPRLAGAGFLHDAEKEYAEARLTVALVAGDPLPDHAEIGVAAPAWLCGLAEAASELRREVLDRLREGHAEFAETLLGRMEDVYDLLVTIDEPDAVTGGLRRTTDTLRAVLERTRADLTLTTVQARLQSALTDHTRTISD